MSYTISECGCIVDNGQTVTFCDQHRPAKTFVPQRSIDAADIIAREKKAIAEMKR